MAVDKEGLLAALAQAGTQGAADYKTAQDQIASQQADAIRMALANGVASSAPAGAQAELSNIVSQPYEASQRHLTENAAASQDWFNRSRWDTGVFQSGIDGLREALIARAQAEAAGGGGGGSGGGGSGGGGSGDAGDWYSGLKDAFGTADLGWAGIKGETQNDWHQSGVPDYEAARQHAINDYGVPAGIAATKFAPSKDETALARALGDSAKTVKNRHQLKRFVKDARALGTQSKATNRGYYQNQAIQQARQQVQAHRQKKKQHHKAH